MSKKTNTPADDLYIPIPVIKFILAHRRRRLAALAQQQNAAPETVSQANSDAANPTPAAERPEQPEDSTK